MGEAGWPPPFSCLRRTFVHSPSWKLHSACSSLSEMPAWLMADCASAIAEGLGFATRSSTDCAAAPRSDAAALSLSLTSALLTDATVAWSLELRALSASMAFFGSCAVSYLEMFRSFASD